MKSVDPQAAGGIPGVDALLATSPARYRDSARATEPLYERRQLAALVRVAARRAARQTARTLADFLESEGLAHSAAELRELTPDDLAQALDLAEEG